MQNILIHKDNTILQALEKLNTIRDVSRLMLFVNDDNNNIIGSLTDGDIRRSLINHADVYKKVGEVCFRDFVFEYDKKVFLDLNPHRKNNIKILPILDQKKRFLRILDLDKIKAVLPIECVIMAGGRGKRLSPLTDNVPKPMLILGDKPIIEHNIDRLISFGIKKIFISINYLGNKISEYFGDGSSKGIEIEYIIEENFLGTAGALSLVNEFKSDHILLMNSDLYTNVDFEELYLSLINNNIDMAISSTQYKVDVPYAIFDCDDNNEIKLIKEKPSYSYSSNAGIYIFKKEFIKEIPKEKYFDITDLIEKLLLNQKKIIHVPIRGYWIDIGNPTDYKLAQENIKHS
jgi:dTDP-glucose pyrophosphorylase